MIKGRKIIEGKNLQKKFCEGWCMDDFNLCVEENQSLVVIGKSGTGKSVLMRLLFGFLPLDNGSIFVRGEKIISKDIFEEIKKKIGYIGFVFQSSALFDSMTVEENINFTLKNCYTCVNEQKKRVKTLLEEVDLNYKDTAHLYPSELSGGMQRRVAFARSLAMNPPLCVFDEPTAGLDSVTSYNLATLIKKKIDQYNFTSITITHDLTLLSTIASHVLLMDKGKKIWYGPVDDFWKSNHPMIKNFIDSVRINKII